MTKRKTDLCRICNYYGHCYKNAHRGRKIINSCDDYMKEITEEEWNNRKKGDSNG